MIEQHVEGLDKAPALGHGWGMVLQDTVYAQNQCCYLFLHPQLFEFMG